MEEGAWGGQGHVRAQEEEESLDRNRPHNF